MLRISETKWSLGVFSLAAAFVLWSFGSRFVLANNDEGIYLSAATRMLRGEIPYRDFFIYVGPGSPLIDAVSLRVFGGTLWAGRVPLSMDLGVMTACVFWMVKRLGSLNAAIPAALCFLAFETSEYDRMVADHRWDSSAFATVAVALLISLIEKPSTARAALAGACAAMAAWITTPVAAAALVVFGAGLAIARLRPLLIWMVAGAGAVSLGFAAWLGAHSALRAAMAALLWPAANYVSANRSPYGWVIGGYANLFRGATAGETVVTLIILLFMTLPATLPIIGAMVWPVRFVLRPKEPRTAVMILLFATGAMVISTFPRPDLIHLMYASPAAYALAAIFAARSFGTRTGLATALIFLLAGASEFDIAIVRRMRDESIPSRIGRIRGTASDLDVFQFAAQISPASTLFVFPYWPIFYFTTGARNPTRYLYLQPGMFSAAEERIALEELEKSPPDRILYFHTTPEAYLRIWPASDPARLRFPQIEDFIASRYRDIDRRGDFTLLALQASR